MNYRKQCAALGYALVEGKTREGRACWHLDPPKVVYLGRRDPGFESPKEAYEAALKYAEQRQHWAYDDAEFAHRCIHE